MVDESAKLLSDTEKRLPEFQRPRWESFAYIIYGEEADIERMLGRGKFLERIIADEQTAFRKVTRCFSLGISLIPSEKHLAPLSLVNIHVRRLELTREEFQHRLLSEHATVVLAQGAMRELVRWHAQLHTFGVTQEDVEAERMDAVSVISCASLNDVEDYLVSPGHEAFAASEASYCSEGSGWWTAVNYSVIDRIQPELAAELPN